MQKKADLDRIKKKAPGIKLRPDIKILAKTHKEFIQKIKIIQELEAQEEAIKCSTDDLLQQQTKKFKIKYG